MMLCGEPSGIIPGVADSFGARNTILDGGDIVSCYTACA